MGHSERDHALLGPSNAYQWAACPPSARLSEGLPDTGSEAAKEGTLAHELAELKLRNYFFSQDFGKRKLAAAVKKLKEDPLWNDEMMGYTDDYLDYVRAAALSFQSEPSVAIEKRVDISGYVPECFGTADCLLIGSGIIHVIDFKYGKNPSGRVEAENNLQMQLYALGAWTSSRMLYKVDRIRMSIVQPRLPDGITEWEIPLEKLLETGEWIRERAQLAWKGEGEYRPDEKTCRFCRAKSRCRARAEKNLELAFAPAKGKLPPLISNEEMGKYLLQGQDVAKWLSDLQDCALQECLAGRDVPGWKAVEGRSTRKWTDMDAAFGRLIESGINAAVLWERKPVTLAQIEKIVGKKDFAECVGEYVVKESGKPALVQESDNRPAITNRVAAAEAFKEEES